MLDKTKKGAKAADAYLPLKEHKDYKTFLRKHGMLHRRIEKHNAIERDINAIAQGISRFAQAHRIELIPSGKTHKLPDGGALKWGEVGPRISCGEGSKVEDLVKALQDPALGLSDCVETKDVPNETLLAQRLREKPELVQKIQEKLPNFSTGTGYEQFTIQFAGEEKSVKGNLSKNAFKVSASDKKS